MQVKDLKLEVDGIELLADLFVLDIIYMQTYIIYKLEQNVHGDSPHILIEQNGQASLYENCFDLQDALDRKNLKR